MYVVSFRFTIEINAQLFLRVMFVNILIAKSKRNFLGCSDYVATATRTAGPAVVVRMHAVLIY